MSEISDRFDYIAPDAQRIALHETVRNALKEVALDLEVTGPSTREKSLAITKLEEAMFWADAHIARNIGG